MPPQLQSLPLRMRLLLLILSVAFCGAFRVADFFESFIEDATERETEDHIIPVFLITFFGALFKNILTAKKKEEPVVQGGTLFIVEYMDCKCFPAVLITGGFSSSGNSAEIYIPSNSSSCVLPRLPVFRKHSNILSISLFSYKFQVWSLTRWGSCLPFPELSPVEPRVWFMGPEPHPHWVIKKYPHLVDPGAGVRHLCHRGEQVSKVCAAGKYGRHSGAWSGRLSETWYHVRMFRLTRRDL